MIKCFFEIINENTNSNLKQVFCKFDFSQLKQLSSIYGEEFYVNTSNSVYLHKYLNIIITKMLDTIDENVNNINNIKFNQLGERAIGGIRKKNNHYELIIKNISI
jgi:hypothetical protein